MYKIVFIGSNPSQRSHSIVPFWNDTKSQAVLAKWIAEINGINVESIHFLNVSNIVTPKNRPLKTFEIKVALPRLQNDLNEMKPDKIIALGKTAAKALTLLRLDFYEMPHPSGLNRKLNDPKYTEEKINGLKNYLSPSKSETESN